MNIEMLKYNPSLLACGAIYMAMKLTKKQINSQFIQYNEEMLRGCAMEMGAELKQWKKGSCNVIKEYSSEKRGRVIQRYLID